MEPPVNIESLLNQNEKGDKEIEIIIFTKHLSSKHNFSMKTIKTLFSIVLIVFLSTRLSGQNNQTNPKSASAIIENIILHTGAPKIPNTVDVIKEGNPSTNVTGIVTCMFATMDVMKQAIEKKCNLIIVHEPLFYNHLDETKDFQNDPVFLEKKKFIDDNHLIIWRFHDYIHSINPDGIETGMVEKLGWGKYAVKGSTEHFILPETTLNELLAYLKGIFGNNAFYVIGKPGMKLTSVALAVGAPGSMKHIRMLEDKNTDVLIAGESSQWETYEYMRDAVDQGRKKAVIFLGHIPSEEAGMNYCAVWLKGFIKDIPITFISGGPSFWSY
jgi:putative NIF3 family GTP cyclohydrolase 1 type 2